jgi:hypothetical protein
MNDWDPNTMKEIDMNHGHDLPGTHQVGNQPCRPGMHRYEKFDSTIMYIAAILNPKFPHFNQDLLSGKMHSQNPESIEHMSISHNYEDSNYQSWSIICCQYHE